MSAIYYIRLIVISCLLLVFGIACKNPMGVQQLDETPTRGHTRIVVDESFQLLLDTQLFTFQSLYVDAKIDVSYKPEYEVIQDFMNDTVRTIVITRDLTKSEKEYLTANNFIPRTTIVAHDALALIVNPENDNSEILVQQFNDILAGRLSTWNQITPGLQQSIINVVFDNNKSGNVRYFREKFSLNDTFPSNCFAVNSNEDVIEYVKNNKSALGILSVNWISDTQDSVSQRFLKSIKVLSVGTNIDNTCKPFQGYIAEGSYPFCRDVYMIRRETFSGLGSGFTSFVAGDKGQRIVLKSGLVPATMPVRLIEIHKD
jgi:phosphate transport system substrate-binding protein